MLRSTPGNCNVTLEKGLGLREFDECGTHTCSPKILPDLATTSRSSCFQLLAGLPPFRGAVLSPRHSEMTVTNGYK